MQLQPLPLKMWLDPYLLHVPLGESSLSSTKDKISFLFFFSPLSFFFFLLGVV